MYDLLHHCSDTTNKVVIKQLYSTELCLKPMGEHRGTADLLRGQEKVEEIGSLAVCDNYTYTVSKACKQHACINRTSLQFSIRAESNRNKKIQMEFHLHFFHVVKNLKRSK